MEIFIIYTYEGMKNLLGPWIRLIKSCEYSDIEMHCFAIVRGRREITRTFVFNVKNLPPRNCFLQNGITIFLSCATWSNVSFIQNFADSRIYSPYNLQKYVSRIWMSSKKFNLKGIGLQIPLIAASTKEFTRKSNKTTDQSV